MSPSRSMPLNGPNIRQYPLALPFTSFRIPSVKWFRKARLNFSVLIFRSSPSGIALFPMLKPPFITERCLLCSSSIVALSERKLGESPQVAFAFKVPSGALLKRKLLTVISAIALGEDSSPVPMALPDARPWKSTDLKLTRSRIYSTFMSCRSIFSESFSLAEMLPSIVIPLFLDWFILKPRMLALCPSHEMLAGCMRQTVSEMIMSLGAIHAFISCLPVDVLLKLAVMSISPQKRGLRLLSNPAIRRSLSSLAFACADTVTYSFFWRLSALIRVVRTFSVPFNVMEALRRCSLLK